VLDPAVRIKDAYSGGRYPRIPEQSIHSFRTKGIKKGLEPRIRRAFCTRQGKPSIDQRIEKALFAIDIKDVARRNEVEWGSGAGLSKSRSL
jgi:hypothetical protein